MKITKRNTDVNEISNGRTWMDFLDKETLQLYPGRDDWRKRLIYTMLKWAENKKSIEVLQFCMKYKIPRQTLYDWTKQYPDIGEAYQNMKLLISCNRKVRSMEKELDKDSAYRDMHVLDPEWHDVNKYHSELKKDEGSTASTFNIHLHKPDVDNAEELKRKIENVK